MAWFDQFLRNIGSANAPFGFAPVGSPSQGPVDPAYNAGMSMLGDVGMRMLASGSNKPLQAFGQAYIGAQDNARQKNKEGFAAAEMMSQAEENRKKREEEEKARIARNKWLQSISDPGKRAMLEAYPGLTEDYIKATDPTFQTADAGGNWGASVVPMRNKKTGELAVGQFNQGQPGIFVNGQRVDPAEWSYDPGGLSQERAEGSMLGNAPKGVIDEYNKKIRPAISETTTALSAVDEAEKLISNVQTGTGAEIVQAFRGWGATLGLNVDESILADTQKYQNFISQVVVPRMQALGGNDSNEELRYLKSTMGGDINQSREALQATLSLTRKLLQKRLEGYRAVEQYVLPMVPGLPPVPDVSPLASDPGAGSAEEWEIGPDGMPRRVR